MSVIYYSPFRYLAVVVLAVIIAILMLVIGFVDGQWVFLAAGIFSLIFSILFWRASQSKLRPGAVALTREGNFLVGGEIPQPLPIAETTFEITDDHQGSWVVELYYNDRRIVLSPGGWAINGERHIKRAAADRALLELGLAKRS